MKTVQAEGSYANLFSKVILVWPVLQTSLPLVDSIQQPSKKPLFRVNQSWFNSFANKNKLPFREILPIDN